MPKESITHMLRQNCQYTALQGVLAHKQEKEELDLRPEILDLLLATH